MTTAEYQVRLSKTLIDKFQIDFREKTGLNAIVEVPGINNLIKAEQQKDRPSLPMIKYWVEESIPSTWAIRTIATRSRKRRLVDLKQIFCKIARDYGYKLLSICEHVYPSGDHADVIHAFRTAEDQIETNEDYKDLYVSILNKIQDEFRIDQPPSLKENNTQPILSAAVL